MKKLIRIIALITIVFNISTAIAQETGSENKLQLDVPAVNKDGQTEIEAQNKIILDAANNVVESTECEKGCKKACCASKAGKAEGKIACKPGCEKACCATTDGSEKKKSCCKSKKSGTAATCDSKKKKCKKACKKKEGVS